MKKLLKYRNGKKYVIGGMADIWPNVDYEPEEYDLTNLSNGEFKELQKNPMSNKFNKKIKKIK